MNDDQGVSHCDKNSIKGATGNRPYPVSSIAINAPDIRKLVAGGGAQLEHSKFKKVIQVPIYDTDNNPAGYIAVEATGICQAGPGSSWRVDNLIVPKEIESQGARFRVEDLFIEANEASIGSSFPGNTVVSRPLTSQIEGIPHHSFNDPQPYSHYTMVMLFKVYQIVEGKQNLVASSGRFDLSAALQKEYGQSFCTQSDQD